MSYVVNVHYKSDPEDLLWQYSGKTHTCLQDAVDELISAQKQPHIDKAIVSGGSTRSDKSVSEKDVLKDAIVNALEAHRIIIEANEKIAHIPAPVTFGATVYSNARDMIDHNIKKGRDCSYT